MAGTPSQMRYNRSHRIWIQRRREVVEVLTGVNVGGRGSRWPELLPWKRSEVPGGAGVQGWLHDARRDTGRLEATSACSGEVPNDGAARFLAADVRGSSGDGLLADSLRDSRGKGSRRRATTRGGEGARREWRGSTVSPGSFETRPRQQRFPASYSGSVAA